MVLVNRYLYLLSVLILFIVSPCKSNMSGKIVGGDYTTIRHYPHAVFIVKAIGEHGNSICGSSVLNQRILLTAAHCLVNEKIGYIRDGFYAFAGSENYAGKTCDCLIRSLKQIKIHEHYNEKRIANDIALGELDQDLVLNNKIKRVILPRRFPSDINGVVAGWGVVDFELKKSDLKLKFITVQLQPKSVCSNILVLKQPSRFCAANSKNYRHYAAPGDSGSGLVTPKGEILGIASFAHMDYINVLFYTNVSFYYNWIKTNSRNMVCRQ